METLPNGERKVTLHELWSAIGGGTKFTHDELSNMAFGAQKERKNFYVQHHDYRFVVQLEDLDLYFRENPLPESAKSLEDQVAGMKKRLEDMQMENALLRDELQRSSLPVPPPMFEQSPTAEAPRVAQDPPPPPAGNPSDRVSFSKIQDELKKELQSGKQKVVTSRSAFAPKAKTMPPAAPEPDPDVL